MTTYSDFEIDLPIGKIRASHNNTRCTTRLLCLHGWLDNRASFLPMLPFLQEVECVAIDMIGHGESSHRPPGSLYHYIDYVRDIKLILDALGWGQCHLLGHSMGGSLSLLSACAYPTQIKSLSMVDSLHPQSRTPADGPEMLRLAMEQATQHKPDRQKRFSSLDQAIKARLGASPFRQTEENARLIMDLATQQTDKGYLLRSDARLKIRSPIMMSQSQVESFIQSVEQPVLAVLGDQGIVKRYTDIDHVLSLFRNIRTVFLQGGHHLHMEKPQQVAEQCLAIIQEVENSTAEEK